MLLAMSLIIMMLAFQPTAVTFGNERTKSKETKSSQLITQTSQIANQKKQQMLEMFLWVQAE